MKKDKSKRDMETGEIFEKYKKCDDYKKGKIAGYIEGLTTKDEELENKGEEEK